MCNKNMEKILIILVLKYLTVTCNRSLVIPNKGDYFDVIGNQCPIHIMNDVVHDLQEHISEDNDYYLHHQRCSLSNCI